MGSASVSTHRGLVHWQGLLLLVSLLTFWSMPTTAQLSVESTHCAKGEDVVLHICNTPPETIALVWYRGIGVDKNNVIAFFIMTSTVRVSGPGNDGREIIAYDGSLLLKKVTMNETGTYTVVAHLPDSKKEIAFGQLDVYEYLRVPILLASSYRVIENKDDVVLTCYTDGKSPQWFFNGTNLKFTDRMNLTEDGRKLTINPVTREDAGNYKCKVSNPIMSAESSHLQLYVYYD